MCRMCVYPLVTLQILLDPYYSDYFTSLACAGCVYTLPNTRDWHYSHYWYYAHVQDVRLLFEYSLNALQIYHWTHISQITNITHMCRLCVYSLTTLQIFYWTDVTHITDITHVCVYILWLHFKYFWTHITHITSRHSRVQDVWIPCGHTPDTSGLTLLTLLTLPHYSRYALVQDVCRLFGYTPNKSLDWHYITHITDITHTCRMCAYSVDSLQMYHWTHITHITDITHMCRMCVNSLTTLQIYHWTHITHITHKTAITHISHVTLVCRMCVYPWATPRPAIFADTASARYDSNCLRLLILLTLLTWLTRLHLDLQFLRTRCWQDNIRTVRHYWDYSYYWDYAYY